MYAVFAYYDVSHCFLPPDKAMGCIMRGIRPLGARLIRTDPLPFASDVAHDLLAMEMEAAAGEPPP